MWERRESWGRRWRASIGQEIFQRIYTMLERVTLPGIIGGWHLRKSKSPCPYFCTPVCLVGDQPTKEPHHYPNNKDPPCHPPLLLPFSTPGKLLQHDVYCVHTRKNVYYFESCVVPVISERPEEIKVPEAEDKKVEELCEKRDTLSGA